MQNPNRRSFLGYIAAPAAVAIVFALGGCTADRDRRPRYSHHPGYYDDYYYYTHMDVYYHLFSGDYYYRRNGKWLRTRKLPRDKWIDGHYRVKLRVDDEVPYRRHHEHLVRHGMPGRWERDRDRKRSEWEKRDRKERRHNIDRHIEYHRKD